jgi:quinol monooxygenase YgiN
MIHVLATIELEPGTREQFLPHFLWLTPLVRAEDGCIEYGAAIDLQTEVKAQIPLRPDVVIVVEKWRDLAALRAHSVAPHMDEYRERVRGMMKKVTLQILEPIEPTAG